MGMNHSRLEASTSLRNLLHHDEGKLITLLYNQEWEKAIARLGKHPREAMTPFVLHKQRVYPLHAACALPDIPLSVVHALIAADPEGAKRFSYAEGVQGHRSRSASVNDVLSVSSVDSDGETSDGSGGEWLPLHVAVYYGVGVNVVEFLIQQYPAAVTCKTARGMLPLHLAVTGMIVDKDRTVHVTKLLLESFPESLYIPSSGRENKTASEFMEVTDTNPAAKEQLLALLHPQQSYRSSRTKGARVVQSLPLESNPISRYVFPYSSSYTAAF